VLGKIVMYVCPITKLNCIFPDYTNVATVAKDHHKVGDFMITARTMTTTISSDCVVILITTCYKACNLRGD